VFFVFFYFVHCVHCVHCVHSVVIFSTCRKSCETWKNKVTARIKIGPIIFHNKNGQFCHIFTTQMGCKSLKNGRMSHPLRCGWCEGEMAGSLPVPVSCSVFLVASKYTTNPDSIVFIEVNCLSTISARPTRKYSNHHHVDDISGETPDGPSNTECHQIWRHRVVSANLSLRHLKTARDV